MASATAESGSFPQLRSQRALLFEDPECLVFYLLSKGSSFQGIQDNTML
ncbi:MAG: hypothetical protein HYY37_05795 [Candidatus Aenigmarchaeota archaeon]|nr:hypothetical protein [Candidatus Aenigmarchaeota archaeon]